MLNRSVIEEDATIYQFLEGTKKLAKVRPGEADDLMKPESDVGGEDSNARQVNVQQHFKPKKTYPIRNRKVQDGK